MIRDNLTNDKEDGMNFRQSEIDPCLFYQNGCIMLICVDACLIFAKEKSDADRVIEQLISLDFILTDEGDISAYLGVDVEKKYDDTIILTRPFLIEWMIDSLGDAVTDANIKLHQQCTNNYFIKMKMAQEGYKYGTINEWLDC